MKEFKVTPWEVKIHGEDDYERLVELFGVSKIDDNLLERIKKHTKDLHVLLRRKFFYAHRDLDKVLDDYENGKKFFLFTGRAPSGKMHIGHLIPFVLTKWFQEKFDVNVYIQLPDEEKFFAKKVDKYEKIKEQAYEEAKIIAALGFDPDKTFIFLDSEYIKQLFSAAIYIARNINYNTAKAVFGFTGNTSIGLIFYVALQIAPTFFENSYPLIPCGIDQDPYFRLQRDLAEKFGYKKACTILSKFLWGLKGPYTKMSASDQTTTILIEDDYEKIKEKIMKYAFSGGQPTLELHRKYGGNPDVDICFYWLKSFFEEDDKKLIEIEQNYRSGKLTTGELKEYTAKKINEFLEKIRKKLKWAEENLNKFMYDGKLANKMWNWEFKL